jgi:ketosteroid isomerase-like protein
MPDRDQEIIDRLRRGYEAFSRGDFDAAMEMAHPEIEFLPADQNLVAIDAQLTWLDRLFSKASGSIHARIATAPFSDL